MTHWYKHRCDCGHEWAEERRAARLVPTRILYLQLADEELRVEYPAKLPTEAVRREIEQLVKADRQMMAGLPPAFPDPELRLPRPRRSLFITMPMDRRPIGRGTVTPGRA